MSIIRVTEFPSSHQAKRKRVVAAATAAVEEDNSRKRQSTALNSSSGPAILDATKQLQQFMQRAPKDKPDKAALEAAVAASGKKKTTQQQPQPAQQRKKKEVIDYSAAQAEKQDVTVTAPVTNATTNPLPATVVIGAVRGTSVADPKSKVRSWLLASHTPAAAAAAALPKSKSSPMNLQANPVAGLQPTRPTAAGARNAR